MTQNRSPAVMAQRIEPNDSLDDFPTMPWGTRALMEHVVIPNCGKRQRQTAWEPSANRGYMVRPLQEYFEAVYASDVHDYGAGYPVVDFLWPGSFPNERFAAPDWIIANPPFRLAEEFIARAHAIAKVGVAMLVRISFLETVGRYERVFSRNPPSIIAQYAERLPMVKGRIRRDASTATAYCWLVWIDGLGPQPFQWIPPCRAKLERDSDY